MVFVGYEPGTKGYRFYNPATRHVHISRDAMFEEGRSWDWQEEKGAGPSDDTEPFHIEYITTVTTEADMDVDSPPRRMPPLQPAASSSATPTCGSEPRTPGAGTPPELEFATPPTGTPDLDVNHDMEAPLRFRMWRTYSGLHQYLA